ncbi:Transcriptional regulator OS=Streptomyces microflavus OX=1919 GN=Smic_21690 PE=4 SV=1 [Streptomyces microflavus]
MVLDEAVRPIGGHEVMRAQLGRLLEFASNRWMQIQVLPFEAGEHASLDGSFNLLRFDGDPDLIYTEDLISGHMTANPDTIREASLRYAHLQATALSVEESVARISRVMEERYGDRP